jgi:hypothetical protein
MTHIELSQEELDLIQAKRDQEAAKEKQKQDRIQADIVKGKAEVRKRIEENEKQHAAARAFLKELGAGWEEQMTEEERTQRVYWGQEVVWSEAWMDRRIYLTNGKYRVSVTKHTVYSNSWHRGTDKGYKMFVSGPEIEYAYAQKALSKAATVNKKIQDCIETINAREEHKKKKLSAVETAVGDLKMKFPEATVTAHKDWTRGYSNRNPYREYDKIVVKLPNGIEISYEAYADGSLSRKDVLFNCQDEIALIGALGAIELPSTTK